MPHMLAAARFCTASSASSLKAISNLTRGGDALRHLPSARGKVKGQGRSFEDGWQLVSFPHPREGVDFIPKAIRLVYC